ncbi:MAG: biotin-dependent carboxyltransferase family protein [Lachnospiraceae bacterium]|nr:biotin-dependent carboxyltransferase family protein [Lachnospiraceae bacterium]
MAMEILEAGALTTIQDQGHRGGASRGYQENGVCDCYSYQIANLLAGNLGSSMEQGRRNTVRGAASDGGGEAVAPAVLEMTLRGAEIRFSSHEIVALAGADMMPQINGVSVPMYCPLILRPGDVLKLGTAAAGLRTYLAVHGGINAPLLMGSRSTSLNCHIGGLEGRALRAGDQLCSLSSPRANNHIRKKLEKHVAEWVAAAEKYPLPASGTRVADSVPYPILRAVVGPQAEAFTEAGLRVFEQTAFQLSAQSNRMACKLTGAAIETYHGSDMISDGIVAGSVQVASDGMPIVMMADHQTTGGYAKIATVISADLPRLAQRRPGELVGFRFVTPQEAVAATRLMAGRLAKIRQELLTLCGGDVQ